VQGLFYIKGVTMEENKFDSLFKKYGDEFHLDPLLLKAQVKQHSVPW
jgi:hypothetical protein